MGIVALKKKINRLKAELSAFKTRKKGKVEREFLF
jgi:uncharacterized small protein (DUF1192 family)